MVMDLIVFIHAKIGRIKDIVMLIGQLVATALMALIRRVKSKNTANSRV